MGIIRWGANSIQLLESSDKLRRQLRNLDSRAHNCETHKIAVFYVGPGDKCKDEQAAAGYSLPLLVSFRLSCIFGDSQ